LTLLRLWAILRSETFLILGSIIGNNVLNRETDGMLSMPKLYQKEVE